MHDLRTEPVRDEGIVALWPGIRPLIAETGNEASEVSRKEEIWMSPGGVVSIAGGKLSTYRAIVEQVVDLCVSGPGSSALPFSTARRPLVGGERQLQRCRDLESASRAPLHAAGELR